MSISGDFNVFIAAMAEEGKWPKDLIPAQPSDFMTIFKHFSHRMDNVSELDLSNKKINELPPEIVYFKAISSLDISNNQIEKLPENFGSLQLHILNMSNNRFTNLPVEVQQMKSLEGLAVFGNEIPEEQICKIDSKVQIFTREDLED